MRNRLYKFVTSEAGAVTVDWVVLTAAVAGLVTAIFFTLGNDTADYSREIGSAMASRGIATY